MNLIDECNLPGCYSNICITMNRVLGLSMFVPDVIDRDFMVFASCRHHDGGYDSTTCLRSSVPVQAARLLEIPSHVIDVPVLLSIVAIVAVLISLC